MKTITNVCRSCKRENVPDAEYLTPLSLCGNCVAEQIELMREQISRLEQSLDQNNQMSEQLEQMQKRVSTLETGKKETMYRAASSGPHHGYVFVEGGSFMMGSPPDEPDRDSDEGPRHRVTVSSFYMKTTPVTQREWREVMGTNPSSFEGDDRPVEGVTWFDAVKYCNALSVREGSTPVYRLNGKNVTANWNTDGYRLPAEAEWEYAARGGNASKGYLYAGGDNVGEVAWYNVNSGGETRPVGGRAPNELGLYDMSGNVYEWCWDWKGSYSSGSQSDPRGPASGLYRVIRGGSWRYSARYLRSAYRYLSPGFGYDDLGFRLVRREF